MTLKKMKMQTIDLEKMFEDLIFVKDLDPDI